MISKYRNLEKADAIIREAIEAYNPSHAFALFSGGHDSLAVTHVAMRHPEVSAAVHINTGIGIEETRTFVRETCEGRGWTLIERHPPELTYEQMVLKYGFPGPGGHLYPFSWLKERALHKLIREHRIPNRNIMLITGVRKQESERRMGHVQPILKDGRKIWVAPLTDWTARDVGDYIESAGLKRNPVVDMLHMSGECLCGAFAKPGELEWISAWYPRIGKQIRDLECRAEEAGVHCKWGVRPPKRYQQIRQGQMELMLCWSCSRRDGEEEVA